MEIHSRHPVDAPPATVWNLLGEEFGNVAQWASPVDRSTLDRPVGVGATRTCDLQAIGPIPAGQLKERLTRFDRGQRGFAFEVIEGMPGMVKKIESAWSVEESSEGRSVVVNHITLEVAWWALPMLPMMRVQLAKAVGTLVRDLRKTVGHDAVPDSGHTVAPAG